jgi:histidyl-tRNA synthetase
MTEVKRIIDKVSMFASDKELEEKLTNKELMLIKMVKIEEYMEDLYRATTSEQNAKLFPPDKSFFKIKELLRELRSLNKNQLEPRSKKGWDYYT